MILLNDAVLHKTQSVINVYRFSGRNRFFPEYDKYPPLLAAGIFVASNELLPYNDIESKRGFYERDWLGGNKF